MKLTFEEYLYEVFGPLSESRIKESAMYSLMAPGKRIRPLLLLAVLKDYGCNPDDGLDAAAALEMVHTYSLIHDDLPAMDDDDYRRGRLTNHKMFDEATAILAGDALLTQAFTQIATSSLSNDIKIQLIIELAESAGGEGMILGQIKDIEAESQPIGWDQLLMIYLLKTGKLLSSALVMGAIIARRSSDVATWRRIGENLGLAFQIQDDILDVTKTTEELGKTANSDISNHKSTAITHLGLKAAKEKMILIYQDVLDDLSNLSLSGFEVRNIIELCSHRQI
ncbi:MAG: polyprenyl synthetase family protein [Firmicutes bacterium HGW-Firmicutes-20]|nr:MAG: polyprenyl synthetase family protein [Firmicutes bacterium HGW-Firmicutes-20]